MEGYDNKSAQSGTTLNPMSRGSYQTVNSVSWKIWHVRPHAITKGGGNKSEGYTSAYAPQTDCKKKQLKDKGAIPTGMVHVGHIKKTTTPTLPTNKEWRQATSEDHDIRYIKRILSSLEETPIDSTYLRNKGYVKPFQKVHLDLYNGLISY